MFAAGYSNNWPDRSELHRIVFAGLDQSIVDKAIAAFMAMPPADRQVFAARINRCLDGVAVVKIDEVR